MKTHEMIASVAFSTASVRSRWFASTARKVVVRELSTLRILGLAPLQAPPAALEVDVCPLPRQDLRLHAPAGEGGDGEHDLEVVGQLGQPGVKCDALEEASARTVLLRQTDEGAAVNLEPATLGHDLHASGAFQNAETGSVVSIPVGFVYTVGNRARRGEARGHRNWYRGPASFRHE